MQSFGHHVAHGVGEFVDDLVALDPHTVMFGQGGHAIFQLGVPAHVIVVEVRAHHEVDLLRGDAVELGVGGQQDAVAEHRKGERLHVVGDDVGPSLRRGPRLGRTHERQAAAHAGAEGDPTGQHHGPHHRQRAIDRRDPPRDLHPPVIHILLTRFHDFPCVATGFWPIGTLIAGPTCLGMIIASAMC